MSGPFENILPADSDTILSISQFGNMLYQARSLSQTLEVIHEATQLERMVDGTLADFSAPQFRKYITKITAPSDVNAPPLDGVFPGMQITIHCAVGMSYLTAGGFGPNHRPPVSGSMYVEGDYTFYRPVLICRVRTVETHFDEWKNIVGWSLEAEEI